MKKMSNKTKDIIILCNILLIILWIVCTLLYYGARLVFAEEIKLSDRAIQNKYYTEQTIINEMKFAEMWNYTENMTEEEYSNTFLGGAKL